MVRRTRSASLLRAAPRTLSADGGLRLAMLGLAGWLPTAADAGPVFGTPGWFAQAQLNAGAPAAASTSGSGTAAGGTTIPIAGSVVTPAAAQALAARSMADLSQAAAAILAAQKAQQQAAQVAAANSIPNGLATGGLAVAAGVAGQGADCAATFSCLWLNAGQPVTSADANGKTVVTVNQTAKKAILTWDSFNIGSNTVLNFDQHLGTQSDGNNDWVALNRVTADASMSKIYGQIKADGTVYLINPNGVLFGAGSKVDVHSLLVSSLPLYLPTGSASLKPGDSPDYLAASNRLFLQTGLGSVGPNTANGNILGIGSGMTQTRAANLLILPGDTPDDQTPLNLPGAVATEAGAGITVSKLGYALLAAPDVANAGTISAVDGQIVLAAGLGVSLKNPAGGSQLLNPVVSGKLVDSAKGNADVTPVTTLSNTGVIEAVRGDARLLAANVIQDGVLAATSSVSRPGSLTISAIDEQATDTTQGRTGSATLTARSVTALLPDGNGETTISTASATQSYQPGNILVTGGAIVAQGGAPASTGQTGALIEAPGQKVTLAAIAQNDALIAPRAIQDGSVAGRVYLDTGATVDVAGIADTQLPMSSNLVSIARLGLNELADSPLQRDSVLYGAAVVIDSRLSGVRDDGVSWVGTPLANLSGYVDQVARNINQMLINGGTVTLAGNEVLSQSGSMLNLDGGFVHYQGGVLQTTRLLTDTGALVDIGSADPNAHYVGIAGLMADKNSRWNVTTTYYSPLLSGGAGSGVYESDYLKGGNGGTLNVYGLSAAVLSGDVQAQGWSGRHQVADGKLALGGTLNLSSISGAAIALVLPSTTGALPPGRSYVVVNQATSLNDRIGGTFTATSVLPVSDKDATDTANLSRWTEVSASQAASAGFSTVTVQADDLASSAAGGEISVKGDANLTVKPGGTINLTGSRISIDGDLTARAGKINLTATGRTWLAGSTTALDPAETPLSGDIHIGANAVLDARGQWINDIGRDADSIDGAAAINGGAISLTTLQNAVASGGAVVDTTGSILLDKGSRLDVSSGGRVLPSGKIAMKDNVALGKGGDISLLTYVPSQLPFGGDGAPALPGDNPVAGGRLQLDGDIKGYGFSGGGTLSLRTLGIQIGGAAPSDKPWVLALPETWFAATGFGNILLQAEYNAEIAPLAKVVVSQQNYLLNDLLSPTQAATGTDLASAGFLRLGQQDAYHRQAVNFALYGGDFLTWHTAQLGGTPPDYSADGISGATLLGKNATLTVDPGASVTLGSHAQVTVDGTITAPGGSITLTGDTGKGGYAQNPGLIVNGNAWTSANKSVWLGANAVLDVSGTILQDPYAGKAGYTVASAGKVLDGGTITLTDDTGYVIAANCLDTGECSGATASRAATLKANGVTGSLLEPLISGSTWQSQTVTSNAGVIRIGASKGLYFHGQLLAKAGGSTAQGGELDIRPEAGRLQTAEDFAGATALSLSSASIALPDGAKIPGQSDTLIEPDGPTGVLHFGADTLTGSGVTRLHLGVDPTLNASLAPLPTLITDNLKLSLGKELLINTSIISAPMPSVTVLTDANGNQTGKVQFNNPALNIVLTAPYVSLTGLKYGGNYASSYAVDANGNAGPVDANGNPLLRLLFARDYKKKDVIKTKDSNKVITVHVPTEDGSGDTSASTPLPMFYRSVLQISADNMDIGGQFLADGFKSLNLIANNDMRFVTPSTYDYLRDPTNPAKASAIPGSLMTTADINLTAGQIYPASGNKFILTSLSHGVAHLVADDPTDPQTTYTQVVDHAGGTISIHGNGNKTSTPLSAGGSLVFNAETVNQLGVIRAPAGQIVLGAGASASDGDAVKLLSYNAIDNNGASEVVEIPVMATQSVTLGQGSLTSVSLDGLTVPYGVTADGQNLQYNGSQYSAAGAASSSPTLTTSPDKQIRIQGATVKLSSGATVNLSGDGDLLAQEWIAGTGGSRDVLAAYNTSYATGSAVQVPLYRDGRAVYAILPGKQSALAAYDPQLTGDPLIGKSVWLSGVPGLAAGEYTLLPARYAILPGAFRVVQDTSVTDARAVDNRVLPDGTARVAGYFADSITQAHDSRYSAFLVQSGSVWKQYSQYDLTSLNTYFGPSATAALPADAGQLVLQATAGLSLGATLAAASKTGLGAELDIAAPLLQVADHDAAALGGYVKLDASVLDSLGVSRLVLGGVSRHSAEGDIFTAVSNQVVIDTAKDGLRAPEIIALAQTPAATDAKPTPDAGAVTVKNNSVLLAAGQAGRARTAPIQIGLLPDSDANGNAIDGASGDGAFLRLSSGAAVAINRVNVPGADGGAGTPTGLLTVGEGVSLTADGAVSLDATGNTVIAPTVSLKAKSFDADSALVVLTGRSSSTQSQAGLVAGPQLLSQLAGIDDITLRSRGDMLLSGDFTITTTGKLTLSAANLVSDGGQAVIHTGQLTLANQLQSAPATAQSGSGSLSLQADTVTLGDGNLRLSGLAATDILATYGILVAGAGSLDAAGSRLTLTTPLIAAATGSNYTAHTSDQLIATAGDKPATATVVSGNGGRLSLQGASIDFNTAAVAASGSLTLNSPGGLAIGDQAVLDVAGRSVSLYDATKATPGGVLSLGSDGVLDVSQGATLAFGAVSGGKGGSLRIRSGGARLSLNGKLAGQDGAFSLDSATAVNLDALTDSLTTGHVTGAVAVVSHRGDLSLSTGHRLTAADVTLKALGDQDDPAQNPGHVAIAGVIDASGAAGGTIDLYGSRGVSVSGQLLATGSAADQRGGAIRLGTGGQSDGTLDPTLGYEQVSRDNSGSLSLASGAVLDVSGGTAGGLSGGTVLLRAPVLTDGGARVDSAADAVVRGARDVTLETYAVWSTADSGSGGTHFDGIIDPAGRYSSAGVALATGATNAAHQTFYTDTLGRFVRESNPATGDWQAASSASLRTRAGIELVNTRSTVNNGSISLDSAWNLGAQDASGVALYRSAQGVAPALTLHAANQILVNASLSDGFVQTVNVLAPGQALGGNGVSPSGVDLASSVLAGGDSSSFTLKTDTGSIRIDGHTTVAPAMDQVTADNPGALKRDLVTPTVIRTGVGAIRLDAAQDIVFADSAAPGAIYTAGRPVAGSSAGVPTLVRTAQGLPIFINAGQIVADGAGDIVLAAGGNITGVQRVADATGKLTGAKGADLSQYWWPWMQSACLVSEQGCAGQNTSGINFGMFGQGVMSLGGNIDLRSGGNIRDLSVSLPAEWLASAGADGRIVTVYGGGRLRVNADGSLFSGAYYVGKGAADIRVGNGISADLYDSNFNPTATLLALQDAAIDISSGSYAEIGGIYNPSWLFTGFDSLNYSAASSVKVQSAGSSIAFGSMNALPGGAYGSAAGINGPLSPAYGFVLPAHLELTALQGGISLKHNAELFPSADGQLSLLAGGDISLINSDTNNTYIGLIDAPAAMLPSPLNPIITQGGISFIKSGAGSATDLHSATPLHAADSQPLLIYSRNGSLIDGNPMRDYNGAVILSSPKAADIHVGGDIVNLSFTGQNLYASDITTLIAGRDIVNPPLVANQSVPFIELGGPGTLAVQAGRNLGPLTSANEALSQGYLPRSGPSYPGIRTIGNQNNAWLPRDGASIDLTFGVAPGMRTDSFADTYINPATAHDPANPDDALGTPDYRQKLVAFMGQLAQDARSRQGDGSADALLTASRQWSSLSPSQQGQYAAQAWSAFAQLSGIQRQALVTSVFLDILTRVGEDFNNADSRFSGQYTRGFAAINALFPPSAGYTANKLSGRYGADKTLTTGTFDMRGSTVQTQRGGNIDILGPGGRVLVGSTSAPPQVGRSATSAGIGPNNQGILTLENGSIGIFADSSVLLAQSRIFTEQGGDLTIWSSNGDINAGKGAKTSSELPPPEYLCDTDHFCLVDAKSQVSGAGIAVLQTKPDSPKGSATLVAPAGTVDFGEAGARISGNLNVAAAKVANASNVQTGGKSLGLPATSADTGALASGSSTAAAAASAADAAADARRKQQQKDNPAADFLFEVVRQPCAPNDPKCRG